MTGLAMNAEISKQTESDDDDEHFPWHYTEFGVVCVCGSAMDSNEQCLGH